MSKKLITNATLQKWLETAAKDAAKVKAESVSYYGFKSSIKHQPNFLSPKDLAEQLQVSQKTLQRMRDEGTGPAWKRISKKHIRYAIVDVDAWLKQQVNGDVL